MNTSEANIKNQLALGKSIFFSLASVYAVIVLLSLFAASMSPEGNFEYVKWGIRTAIGVWIFVAMFKGSHKARILMSVLFGIGAILLFFQMDGDILLGSLAVGFSLYAASFWLPSVRLYVTSRKSN